MSDAKKKRLSILNAMAPGGAPVSTQPMMSTNRALRSARDAVDSHRVWELEPDSIDDTRFKDRLDPNDIQDLMASIEANGQTVPILVRRDPQHPERYLLVYGRRRLEAVRASEGVSKVRALIATMDESSALRAQVAENTARRDLSYIERALFARELLETGFGNQSQIAEVLNTTKSAISMALSVANGIGPELGHAIGPAHGIGRPRWEALIADYAQTELPLSQLIETALAVRNSETVGDEEGRDRSTEAFLAVAKLVTRALPRPAKVTPEPTRKTPAQELKIAGETAGHIERTAQGLRIELTHGDLNFLSWLEESAQDVVEDLHARWKQEAAK